MAGQTVTYRLLADITQFKAQMANAATSVQTAAGRMTAATKEGAKFRAGLDGVAKASGRVGLVAAAGLGAAVIAAANFDQAMSRVQGATSESAANMDLLRTAAIKAGQDTVFSASEAAGAIEAMAKAGVSTSDILSGGLTGALNLASAGSLDVAQAADIAATTMNQFGLAGSDVSHIADVLAASAGKAQGDVSDMAEALKYVGPVASQMGVSLEETAGSIAYLATQGIVGEQAGTGLRGMLSSLTSPSKSASDEMKKLGINMYDAQGQFIGLDGVAGQLHKHLGDLTSAERDEALGRIFGNQQITAARILYAGGASAIDRWTNSVNDSGYAAQLAHTKMDNLKGDLEQLKGSLETALIGTGEGAQGPLRGLTQGLTGVVNAYSKLPDAAKSGVAGLLGITAITGGGLWFAAKSIQAVGSMRESLDKLGETAPKTAGALKTLGVAVVGLEVLGVASDALDSLVRSFDAASPSVERLSRNIEQFGGTAGARPLTNFKDELGDLPGLLDSVDSRMGKAATSTQGFLGKIPLVGSTVGNQIDFVDQVTGRSVAHMREAQDAFASLDASLMGLANSQGPKAARKAFQDLAQSYNLTADQQQQLIAQLPQFAGVLEDTARGGFHLQELLNGIVPDFTKAGNAADAAGRQINTFKSALLELNGLLDKRDAFRNYQAAIDDFRKSFKKSAGFNLDVDPGRQNQAKLDAIAASAGQVASHLHGLARTQFVKSSIAQLRAMAENMHLPQKQVDILIAGLRTLNHSDAKPDVKPQGIPQANDGINGVGKNMSALDKQTANPHVSLVGATAAAASISGILSHLGFLDSYTATPHVTTIYGHHGTSADGNLFEFASGGYLPRIGDQQPQIRPFSGARGLTWSEQGSGPWEAFISGSPAKADRSKAIATDVVSRLGGQVQFANGGMVGHSGSSAPAGRVIERVIVERLADRVTLVDKNGAIGEFAVRAARSEISDDRGYRATLARQGVG